LDSVFQYGKELPSTDVKVLIIDVWNNDTSYTQKPDD
jgi:hypothetical protein